MAADFVQQIARLLGQSPEETERTLHALADSIRDEVENSGEAEIEGLGVFRRKGDGLSFEPDPSLERAVNHRYAGLLPLDSGPDVESVAKQRSEEAPPPEPSPESADPFEEDALAPLDLPDEPDAEPVRDLASDEERALETASDEPSNEFEDEPEPLAVPESAGPESEPTESQKPGDAFDEGLRGELIEEDAYLDETEQDALPDAAPGTDDDEIDALLEGVWMPATGSTDASHPLGPPPPEMMEEADFSVMDEADGSRTDEPLDEPDLGETPEDHPADEAYGAVPPRAEAPASPTAPEDTVPPRVVPPASPDVRDEIKDTEPAIPPADPRPAGRPPAAPGFAATAASETPATDRGQASRERRSRVPIFGVIAALVLGTLAIFWFLNREPAVPPLEEPAAPIAADTSEAAPPPIAPDAAGDTTAVAEAVPDEPEPEPPSSDPLLSSAGIDPAQGGFAWVVASELSRAPAERRAAAFREQGFRAGVVAEEAGGRTRYRVALGQFSSLDEANQHRSNLPAGVPADTWLLRL